MAKERKKGKSAGKSKAMEPKGNLSLKDRILQFREFFEQSKVEIKKVTWPTRKETVVTSVAVIVLTLVMAAYLGLVDIALAKIVEAVLS